MEDQSPSQEFRGLFYRPSGGERDKHRDHPVSPGAPPSAFAPRTPPRSAFASSPTSPASAASPLPSGLFPRRVHDKDDQAVSCSDQQHGQSQATMGQGVAVSAFGQRAVDIFGPGSNNPSHALIPSNLFTPELDPSSGQLEVSLPIPISASDEDGHAPSPATSHYTPAAAPVSQAQREEDGDPVKALSDKWEHLFGPPAQAQTQASVAADAPAPASAVTSPAPTGQRMGAPPGLSAPATPYRPLAQSRLSSDAPSFSPRLSPCPTASLETAAAPHRAGQAKGSGTAHPPRIDSLGATTAATSADTVPSDPSVNAEIPASTGEQSWPTPAELADKLKHKQSKDELLARKVDEAVTRKGRGHFKLGDTRVEETQSLGRATGGMMLDFGASAPLIKDKQTPSTAASTPLSLSTSRLKQNLHILEDAQTRMKSRIAELEQKLTITHLKAESATQARTKAEALIKEADHDRRTAISAAQKLKGHLDLALRDVGKLREERDAIKAQAELQAAQARQGRAMADEVVERLREELEEVRKRFGEVQGKLSVLEARVKEYEGGANQAASTDMSEQEPDLSTDAARKSPGSEDTPSKAMAAVPDKTQNVQSSDKSSAPVPLDDKAVQTVHIDRNQAADAVHDPHVKTTELDNQANEIAKLKRLVQSYVTTTIHLAEENKRLREELDQTGQDAEEAEAAERTMVEWKQAIELGG